MSGNGVAGWRDLPGQRFKDPQTRAERYAGVPGFGPALRVEEADAIRAYVIERASLAWDAARAVAGEQ